MSTHSLAKIWLDFTTFTAGFYLTKKVLEILLRKPVEKVVTKNVLEEEITELKNSINTTEIIVKNYEEAIKTIWRELEEALKVLREENTEEEEETVKNKRKQLDELEKLRAFTMADLEFLKKRIEKI